MVDHVHDLQNQGAGLMAFVATMPPAYIGCLSFRIEEAV